MAGQGLMKRSTWKTTPPQYNPRVEGLLEQNDPDQKVQEKCRGNSIKLDLSPGPEKAKANA